MVENWERECYALLSRAARLRAKCVKGIQSRKTMVEKSMCHPNQMGSAVESALPDEDIIPQSYIAL